MLITGLFAALCTVWLLSMLSIDFNALVLGRILIGSSLLGCVISYMLFARERMIFLYTMRARISEKIQRIHTTELLHLSQHDELTKISNRRTFDETLDIFLNVLAVISML